MWVGENEWIVRKDKDKIKEKWGSKLTNTNMKRPINRLKPDINQAGSHINAVNKYVLANINW